MSLSAEAKAALLAQQSALVSALLAEGEPPAGFDEERLCAAGASLARKRARAAARAWPRLNQALGRRFCELFADYAAATSLPRDGGPLADGRAFARWLAVRGQLPEAGLIEALAVDLRYGGTQGGLLLRRRPACRAAWLPESRRLMVGIRLPWLGERWLSIPFRWRRLARGCQVETSDVRYLA
jgi:hypothetical protein